MLVAAFTCICLEDVQWIPQYLREAERLSMPFAIHLDRCRPGDDAHLLRLCKHALCLGTTRQTDKEQEFQETQKQAVLNRLVRKKVRWAMAWDIDETFERDAPRKLLQLPTMTGVSLRTPFLHLWEDPRHHRSDVATVRDCFFRLDAGTWRYIYAAVNGPGLYRRGERIPSTSDDFDLVRLHWGMMTPALRQQHKERWDRIYQKAVGWNPYQFWAHCTDPNIPATIEEHDYLCASS